LSNVAVVVAVVVWLVTAMPMLTEAAIVTVTVPIDAHTDPSLELNAWKELPDRVSFSHAGGACVPVPRNVVDAPVAVRAINSSGPPGRMSRSTCAEPAVVVSRIITPAFANEFVFPRPVIRTTIVPSPLSGCDV